LASQRRNSRLCHDQAAPLPSSSVASAARSRSCGLWRRAQPRDQRQDVGEYLSRHRDLGQLESHIAAVCDYLRADLDQLLTQTGQRPCRHRILCFCAGRRVLSKSHNMHSDKLSAQALGRKQVIRGTSKNIPDFGRFALCLLLGRGAAEYLPDGFYLGAPRQNI
jgi:hypothetical protein